MIRLSPGAARSLQFARQHEETIRDDASLTVVRVAQYDQDLQKARRIRGEARNGNSVPRAPTYIECGFPIV